MKNYQCIFYKGGVEACAIHVQADSEEMAILVANIIMGNDVGYQFDLHSAKET